MKYITNSDIRLEVGLNLKNNYVFPSTQNSLGHANGQHAISILLPLNKKGSINTTRNRHQAAILLAKLYLPQKEKDLIFHHLVILSIGTKIYIKHHRDYSSYKSQEGFCQKFLVTHRMTVQRKAIYFMLLKLEVSSSVFIALIILDT